MKEGCSAERNAGESCRNQYGNKSKKMTVDTETWCFAPPPCWSNSQFLCFFKDVLQSFWEQWKFAKSGPLAVCLHRPAACWGTTHFLHFCAAAKLEYRKTSSCVSTHVWRVPLDCRIYTHWSTRDQGCTDDFSPSQGVFGHLKSLLSHEISTCSDRLVGRRLAAGSSGYLRGCIIESSPLYRVILSLSQQRWSVGRRTFTDESIYNVFWIKSMMLHKLVGCQGRKCVSMA